MRVWLLEGNPAENCYLLESRLRQWLDHSGQRDWTITVMAPETDLLAAGAANWPDVIVFPAGCAVPEGLEAILQQGAALVVANSARCEAHLSLGNQYPVHLFPDDPDSACLGLVVVNARDGLRRLSHWQAQVKQLQHRLNDRIVIERAKGVLIHRLGVSEEEAYKRLRLLSRRQRRQIREVAQGLLDAQQLLQPASGEVEEPGVEHPMPEQLISSSGGPLGER